MFVRFCFWFAVYINNKIDKISFSYFALNSIRFLVRRKQLYEKYPELVIESYNYKYIWILIITSFVSSCAGLVQLVLQLVFTYNDSTYYESLKNNSNYEINLPIININNEHSTVKIYYEYNNYICYIYR